MEAAGVGCALCVSVSLETVPEVLEISNRFPFIYASVGVHPNYTDGKEPTETDLASMAGNPRVVAIGETGLDYYRLTETPQRQQERFRIHIRAARRLNKPLIVHTRAAAEDTIKLLQEEAADTVGGVMHCFTENWDVAKAALDLGFYISFSGVLTFRSAGTVREVAAKVPPDRLLVETDSPYLAPVPHRGKVNQPAYVRFVAEELAKVRNEDIDEIMRLTTENFFRLFAAAKLIAPGTPSGSCIT